MRFPDFKNFLKNPGKTAPIIHAVFPGTIPNLTFKNYSFFPAFLLASTLVFAISMLASMLALAISEAAPILTAFSA